MQTKNFSDEWLKRKYGIIIRHKIGKMWCVHIANKVDTTQEEQAGDFEEGNITFNRKATDKVSSYRLSSGVFQSMANELLNRKLKSVSEVPQFKKDCTAWKEQVINELKGLGEQVHASYFNVLRINPLTKFQHAINAEHLNYLRIIAERLNRLSTIIRELQKELKI